MSVAAAGTLDSMESLCVSSTISSNSMNAKCILLFTDSIHTANNVYHILNLANEISTNMSNLFV